MTRYYEQFREACNAIIGVRGGIVYRAGKVSAQRRDEIARWDMHQEQLVAGEGITDTEQFIVNDINANPFM